MRHALMVCAIAALLLNNGPAHAKGYGTFATPTASTEQLANKPRLTIYAGTGAASQYLRQAILADARVQNLHKEYAIGYGSASEALRRGVTAFPAIFVSGRGGAVYKHEGNFRHVEQFIAFVMAAKEGTNAQRLLGISLAQ